MTRFDRSMLLNAYVETLKGNKTSTAKLITGELSVPVALVAESLQQLRYYMCQAIRNHKFIPICVGSPGAPEEVIKSLATNGVWVGNDIPNKKMVLEQINEIKTACKPTVSLARLYA